MLHGVAPDEVERDNPTRESWKMASGVGLLWNRNAIGGMAGKPRSRWMPVSRSFVERGRMPRYGDGEVYCRGLKSSLGDAGALSTIQEGRVRRLQLSSDYWMK